MKRLRVDEGNTDEEPCADASLPNLRESYSVVMTGLSRLSRDERESLIAEAHRFSIAECASLVAQIPDEVWLAVFLRCDEGYSFIAFRIGSVSKQWLRVADSLIVQRYPFVKEQMPRVLRKFTHLETLSLGGSGKCEYIDDETLAYLSNLTTLDLTTNKRITDKALQGMTALSDLNLTATKRVHGKGLHHVYTTLRTLSLRDNHRIRNRHLGCMTNLTSLDLSKNGLITNTSVSLLTNLSTLCLAGNHRIGDATLRRLPHLTELDLGYSAISDVGLAHLETKLRYLAVLGDTDITGTAISRMTNLRSLALEVWPAVVVDDDDDELVDRDLARLTNLTQLRLYGCVRVTNASVKLLTNLVHLSVTQSARVTTAVLPFLSLCKVAEFDGEEMIGEGQPDFLFAMDNLRPFVPPVW